MSKKQLDENIINKFIGAFFDSYKSGLEKSFYDKAKKRDPELGRKVAQIDKSLDDLRKYLKTLDN